APTSACSPEIPCKSPHWRPARFALHTREVAGSKPAASITEGLQMRAFLLFETLTGPLVSVAVGQVWDTEWDIGVTEAPAYLPATRVCPLRQSCRASDRSPR